MTPIENTAAADPLMNLVTAWPGAGGIEAQEAAGQAQVVGQDSEWVQIPWVNDMYNNSALVDQQLRDMGFVLGDQCEDELWRMAKLPEGWSFSGTDHSMWSRIVDEKGFERISIFYKAAFYDRSAHLSIVAVPSTKAQEDALDALYPAYDENYWSPLLPKQRDGDDLIVTFRPRFEKDRPDEEWTQRRRVRVSMTGELLEDEFYDVSPEQAIEEAQKF